MASPTSEINTTHSPVAFYKARGSPITSSLAAPFLTRQTKLKSLQATPHRASGLKQQIALGFNSAGLWEFQFVTISQPERPAERDSPPSPEPGFSGSRSSAAAGWAGSSELLRGGCGPGGAARGRIPRSVAESGSARCLCNPGSSRFPPSASCPPPDEAIRLTVARLSRRLPSLKLTKPDFYSQHRQLPVNLH